MAAHAHNYLAEIQLSNKNHEGYISHRLTWNNYCKNSRTFITFVPKKTQRFNILFYSNILW